MAVTSYAVEPAATISLSWVGPIKLLAKSRQPPSARSAREHLVDASGAVNFPQLVAVVIAQPSGDSRPE